MKVVTIIPVRMAATRFPNKPLASFLGLPMVEHVRRRAGLCTLVSDVIIATCDEAIKTVVEGYGGSVVMTSHTHERCTDRIAEAAINVQADIVVNIQGDEPLLQPRMIEEVVTPLVKDPNLLCANLMTRIVDETEFRDSNAVKVVIDRNDNLLYASREPIPSSSKAGKMDYARWKQLGIIAFRSGFLQAFSRLDPTPLEQIESVDMLRAIEHGYTVRMVETKGRMIGVDVPEQVQEVELLLTADLLTRHYM